MPRHPVSIRLLTLLILATVVAPNAARAAAPLPPARHLALWLKADSLWSARNRTDILPLYRQLVVDDPGDGQSRYRLAVALLTADKKSEAMDELKRTLAEGFASERFSSYQLAVAAVEAGRTEEALAWLDRLLAVPFEQRADLQSDDALAPLRENPRFRAQAGFLPAEITDRVAGWGYDLDFFVTEARRLHGAPERPTAAPAFAQAVSDLKSRVGALDDLGVAIELQKIVVAFLGDGHSVVYPMPTAHVDFGGVLPVRFYLFSDGLFVVGARPEQARLVGRRVRAIGGKPVPELLTGLRALVSRDNDQGLAWMGPLFLTFPAMLRALGAAESTNAATLTLDDAGKPETVTLQSVPLEHPNQQLPPPPQGPAPAWLAHEEVNYWHEARPEMDAWYAQFNQVRDAENGPGIAQWADALRREMQGRPQRNLVLDLRHNNGGNNFLIWPIVRLVAWHEMSDPSHRTWIITGRGTFSACQDLVNFLDRATDAVFVGEPSSSKPNFTGEDTTVILPWSGLRLSISSRYWQDSFPGDRRPYVAVAMPVTLSSAEWKANRDPVMEALAEYLGRDGR